MEKVGRANGRRLDVVFRGLDAQRGLDLMRQPTLVPAAFSFEPAQLDELEGEAVALFGVVIHLHGELVDVGHVPAPLREYVPREPTNMQLSTRTLPSRFVTTMSNCSPSSGA